MSAAASLRADDVALADLVSSGAAELAMPLAGTDVARLVAYVRLIERWNATYNLTAIRDPRDMVTQHVLDCLAAAGALAKRRGDGSGDRLLDVGSGAGLPGIVVAVAMPKLEVTCVDSVGKKAAFITQAIGALGLKNAKAIHGRVAGLRDQFDIVASRAFASLAEFVSGTAHLLDDDGVWMAMKGKPTEAELHDLDAAVAFHVDPLVVPHLAADRCVVWIQRAKRAHAHE